MSARPMIDPDATRPQRRLGKYEVTGVLGEGAMGIVYSAIDPDIHRPVAIKAIHASLLSAQGDDFAAAQRFRNEARAAGRLNHPNIVSVYAFVEAGDEALIVMEHVQGESLHELTAHGERLPLDDALSIVGQLLDALAAAHAQRVWHRDIKPANLLITPQGRLKVTDFGIARIESTQVTQQGRVIGSPGYMAPERYGEAPTDHRVDLFSAGVLLYELLTGIAPFRGSPSQVMHQVLTGVAAPPSSLLIEDAPPPAFDAVIARALARDPAERFADATSMRTAIAMAARRPLRAAVQPETLRRLRSARPDVATQGLPRAATPRVVTPAVPATPAVPTTPIAAAPPTLVEPRVLAPTPVLTEAPPPRPTAPPIAPLDPPAGAMPHAVAGATLSATTSPWDTKLLDRLTALLVPSLGPVAVVMVRQAARRCEDRESLLAELTVDSLSGAEREEFLRRARSLLPAGSRPPTPLEAELLPAAAGISRQTPLSAEVLVLAERCLTAQLGPMAKVLVKRAAQATTREQFFAAIAEQLACDVDRQAVLANLWRACSSR